MSRVGVRSAFVLVCLCIVGARAEEGLLPDDGYPTIVKVGAGSYASRPPRDQNKRPWLPEKAGWGDDSQVYSRMKLYVSPERKGPVPSTDWWTTLVNRRWSGELWALPAMLRAGPDGMTLRHPHAWAVPADGKTAVMVGHHALRVTAADFAPLHAEASDWSDWMVRIRMPDGQGRSLQFTTVHGVPFTFIEPDGVDPRIDIEPGARLFGAGADAPSDRLGVQVGDEWFGIYAPEGTVFVLRGGRLSFTFPGGRRFLSVAPLPEADDLDRLAPYASVVPRKTTVKWSYLPENGRVDTSWFLEVEDLSGQGRDEALQGWLPHHYQAPSRIGFETAGPRYATVKGELRLAAGNRFDIAFPFAGILPEYPAPEIMAPADGYQPERMRAMIAEHLSQTGYGTETYWGGKSIRLFARHMEMARQLGMERETEVFRDRAAEAVRDWLEFVPGEGEHFFAWFPNWGSLVGCRSRDNANPGVDALQDHHMCYGYHVYAAAMLALQDPAFAEDWGPMARLVAMDYANWRDDDPLFCKFRNLDPWSGHSWSNGMGTDTGNEQESSSEAMQGYGAMFLLGEALGDHELRDAAAFCWATEARGIAEYYFDRGRRNFPKEWPHTVAANLHTNGLGFWTWFSGDPLWMHAIQWLPMSPLISHLAVDPAYAASDFAQVMKTHEGGLGWDGPLGNDGWTGTIALNYLACSDPAQAASVFDRLAAAGRGATKGSEATGAYWHIQSLQAYGPLRFDAWTDVATSQAFGRPGGDTAWAVYNASDAPREVRCFDNGNQVATFTAPPRRMSVMRGGAVHVDKGMMPSVPPPAPRTAELPASFQATVTASSQQDGATAAAHAVDGDASSRWASQPGDKEWLTVDLGASRSLSRVELVWEAAFGKDYDIQVSDNGFVWVTMAEMRGGSGGRDVLDLNAKARYVRMQGVKRGTEWGYSLYTFDVFADEKAASATGERLVVEPELAQVNERGTVPFRAYFADVDGRKRPAEVEWEVRGKGHISPEGVFTPDGAGVFDRPRSGIWARSGDQRAQAYVVVEEALRVKNLELEPFDGKAPVFMTVGDRRQVNATARDQFGAWLDLPIQLSATGSVKLENGWLEAVGVGDGMVGAELAGVAATQAVTVRSEEDANLAAGCAATALSSENDGTDASKAFDGNRETRWASQFTDPQWLRADLGRKRAIGRVVLVWEAAHAKSYRLETSDDGETWNTVHVEENCQGKTEDIQLPPGTEGRYVRMYGVSRVTGYGYSLYEMEIYSSRTGGLPAQTGPSPVAVPAPPTGVVPTPVAAGMNVAKGCVATASSSEGPGTAAEYAFDGNKDSRWSSLFTDPQWLQADLGQRINLAKVVLVWENAHAKSYRIEVGDDGVNWKTVHEQADCQGKTEEVALPPGTAGRFVRLFGTSRASPYGYSLFEMEIHSAGGAAVPAAVPPSSATAAKSAAAPASGGKGNLAAGCVVKASSFENEGTGPEKAFDGNRETRWSSQFTDPQWLEVDLGKRCALGRVVLVWEASHAKSYRIETSDDGQQWKTVHSQEQCQGKTEEISLPGGTAARYIRLWGVSRVMDYGYSLFEMEVYGPGE